MKITPTKEQKEIISAIEGGNNLLISAFAGTGKTSTLQLITSCYNSRRFLYLAYNKSLQLESQKKFGTNVTCLTIHGMAYKAIGKLYKEKLNLKFYSSIISRVLKVKPVRKYENNKTLYGSPERISACAKSTVTNFCNSSSVEITPYHLDLVE